jgi:hypothetical protein
MAALAPGVSYPLAGHRPTLWGVTGFLVLWAVGFLLWLQAWGWDRLLAMPWPWWLMVLAWIFTAAGWWLWWRRVGKQEPSELVWEPTQRLVGGRMGAWLLFTPAWPTGLRAAHVAVILDFQALMLLQFQAPQGLQVWCWLWRGSEPRDWLALRRAVFHQPGQQKPL